MSDGKQQYSAHLPLIDGITDPNHVPKKDIHLWKALAPGSCPLGGQSFPDQAHICYGGSDWQCQGGTWIDQHTKC